MSIAIDINGECVTVRDVRRNEHQLVFVLAAPLLAELRDCFVRHDGPPPLAMVLVITDKHRNAWHALLARCSGRSVDWIAGLSDADATRLGLAFFAAGVRFWRLVGSKDLRHFLAPRSDALFA